jgi:hypothetical protein
MLRANEVNENVRVHNTIIDGYFLEEDICIEETRIVIKNKMMR